MREWEREREKERVEESNLHVLVGEDEVKDEKRGTVEETEAGLWNNKMESKEKGRHGDLHPSPEHLSQPHTSLSLRLPRQQRRMLTSTRS